MIGTSVMKELAQNESNEKKITYWQNQYYKIFILQDFYMIFLSFLSNLANMFRKLYNLLKSNYPTTRVTNVKTIFLVLTR